MTSTRLFALGAGAALALMGCASYNQTPNLELASRPAPQGLANLGTETTSLKLGTKEMEVPIRITWTRVKDGDCSRVGAVKVERTGGSDGVQVEAQIGPGSIGRECATSLDLDGPPDRFDDARILFAWKARRGIKTIESSKHPVYLRGNGEVTAEDDIRE